MDSSWLLSLSEPVNQLLEYLDTNGDQGIWQREQVGHASPESVREARDSFGFDGDLRPLPREHLPALFIAEAGCCSQK